MRAACPFLFVYGTLRRGSSNSHAVRLAREADWAGRGTISGRLYMIDWYPGLIPGTGGEQQVTGDVYRLHDPEATLAALDEYEGDEFERGVGTVRMEGGASLECWLYVYRGQPREDQLIRSGEFIAT